MIKLNTLSRTGHKLTWVAVSKSSKLTEDQIREFKDCLNWTNISKYQQLSEDFIIEFQDYIDWCVVLQPDREYSDEFYRLYYQKLKGV